MSKVMVLDQEQIMMAPHRTVSKDMMMEHRIRGRAHVPRDLEDTNLMTTKTTTNTKESGSKDIFQVGKSLLQRHSLVHSQSKTLWATLVAGASLSKRIDFATSGNWPQSHAPTQY
jgi:hypothetical protein